MSVDVAFEQGPHYIDVLEVNHHLDGTLEIKDQNGNIIQPPTSKTLESLTPQQQAAQWLAGRFAQGDNMHLGNPFDRRVISEPFGKPPIIRIHHLYEDRSPELDPFPSSPGNNSI